MDNLQKIIQEIDDEILGSKQELINRSVLQTLQNFKFEENNLSPSLISLLMSKTQVKVPAPEPRNFPQRPETGEEEIADIFSDNVAKIFVDLQVGNNVYLFGKAGTGKTTLAKKIAQQLMKLNTYVINCNQFTSPVNIIGGQTIDGYKQGALSLAWERGGCLILDELPKLDPNTAGLLNEALAAAADRPVVTKTTKAEYEKYVKAIEEAAEKEEDLNLDYEIVERGDEYIKTIFVTMTDGSGKKLKKHESFCVIATGNTDMKTISANFSGNNRQDYSLVDRFVGSYYKIEYDSALEQRLTYNRVYEVATMLRRKLDEGDNLESVSLRTMLNFNRIFEQQYLRLYKCNPKFLVQAIEVKMGDDYRPVMKDFKDSVESFIKLLPKTFQDPASPNGQVAAQALSIASMEYDKDEFIDEFIRIHGINPITAEYVK